MGSFETVQEFLDDDELDQLKQLGGRFLTKKQKPYIKRRRSKEDQQERKRRNKRK